MVSLSHELLVDLFRQQPALVAELLATRAGIDVRGLAAGAGSIDVSQAAPAEFRADWLTVFRNRRRVAVAALIVEVQLQIDRDKEDSWPVYVAAARASLRCPVTLVVLATSRAVARWARRSIELGHPGYSLRPIVIDDDQVPRFPDEATARGAPELAVLSALVHRDLEAAKAAIPALDEMSEDNKKLYWAAIKAALPTTARRALEAHMSRYIYKYGRKWDWGGKIYSDGEEAGLRRAVVALVSARLPRVGRGLASRLRDQPERLLLRLVTKLGKARDAAEVRAVLDLELGLRA